VLRYGAARFIEELAAAVNRVNYNQPNEVLNAMAGQCDAHKLFQMSIRGCTMKICTIMTSVLLPPKACSSQQMLSRRQ